MAKKGYTVQLTALDDDIENAANQAMVKRLLS